MGAEEYDGDEELRTHGICDGCIEKHFPKKNKNNADDSIHPVALMRVTQITDPDELLTEFNKEDVIIEEKLDGWKIQIVKSNNVVRLYSRRGDEKTDNFPYLISELDYLPNNTIVEGELVYWENNSQDVSKVISLAGSSPEHSLEKAKELSGEIKIHLYDILWLNGEDVTARPFIDRRKLLEQTIEQSDKVQITKQYPFDQWQEAMNIAVKKGGEGIVLKITTQPYEYKELGENEPKPKGIMYKYKGSGGKSETDDYVIYSYDISDKGQLRAQFGQYLKGTLYHISDISNFSAENEEIIKQKLKNGPFVVELGFQERIPGGLRHQKFVRFRDDKNYKDATMNEFHAQNVDNFEIIKTAAFSPDVKDLLDEIISHKPHKLTGLRNVPGVDVRKAYEIFSSLESSNRFIVGDSGTSFGKTQVQLGSFLNAAASDPNITEITGLTSEQLRGFSSDWVKNQKLLSQYDWKRETSVDINEVNRNKSNAIPRMEGTIVRMFPNGQPGVVRIINGKAIAEILDLNVLQRYGFKIDNPSVRSKIDYIMKQFVTWAVVRNSLARVLTYQQMPDLHDKIMATFSGQNVNKNQRLSDLTDNIIQTNLSDKIESVANSVKRYGYDTSAPGAYNIYQLIAIANASGPGRVEEFLKSKKPFYSGNLTYLQRANKKIQEVTGIPTGFPQDNGMGGFKYASSVPKI